MQKAHIVDVDAGKRSFVPSVCKRESRQTIKPQGKSTLRNAQHSNTQFHIFFGYKRFFSLRHNSKNLDPS